MNFPRSHWKSGKESGTKLCPALYQQIKFSGVIHFFLILWSFKLVFHRWTPFAPGIHYLIYFRNQAQDPQIWPIHTLAMQDNGMQRSLLSYSTILPTGNHFCGCCAPRTATRVYRAPSPFPLPPSNCSSSSGEGGGTHREEKVVQPRDQSWNLWIQMLYSQMVPVFWQ